MTNEEIKEIIEKHQHWFEEDCEGWENMKADLREADLREADLSEANLRGANLSEANLRGANLRGAIEEKDCDYKTVKLWNENATKEREELYERITELEKQLESEKASRYAESVDVGMRERRLKRALWLARAERANEIHFMWCQLIYDTKYGIVKFNVRKNWWEENVKQGQTLHTPQGWADVWYKIEYKCRAKAEEYNG